MPCLESARSTSRYLGDKPQGGMVVRVALRALMKVAAMSLDEALMKVDEALMKVAVREEVGGCSAGTSVGSWRARCWARVRVRG